MGANTCSISYMKKCLINDNSIWMFSCVFYCKNQNPIWTNWNLIWTNQSVYDAKQSFLWQSIFFSYFPPILQMATLSRVCMSIGSKRVNVWSVIIRVWLANATTTCHATFARWPFVPRRRNKCSLNFVYKSFRGMYEQCWSTSVTAL